MDISGQAINKHWTHKTYLFLCHNGIEMATNRPWLHSVMSWTLWACIILRRFLWRAVLGGEGHERRRPTRRNLRGGCFFYGKMLRRLAQKIKFDFSALAAASVTSWRTGGSEWACIYVYASAITLINVIDWGSAVILEWNTVVWLSFSSSALTPRPQQHLFSAVKKKLCCTAICHRLNVYMYNSLSPNQPQ